MKNAGVIFSILCTGFISYTAVLYTMPAADPGTRLSEISSEGKMVWQRYNCQACHQLFGLGGYLGPDLTNITADEGKSDAYLKAMIRSGTIQMPQFNMSEGELDALISFLHAVNAAGNGDPRSFRIHKTGMISNE